MADFRSVQTRMWREDEWFVDLPPDAKLLWIWMQTNEQAGEPWQSIETDRIMREVRLSAELCGAFFRQFENDGRIEIAWHKGEPIFRIFLSDTRCASCGAGFDMTVDHIKPHSWGGTNDPDNLQWLCRHCNSSKGNRHETRY